MADETDDLRGISQTAMLAVMAIDMGDVTDVLKEDLRQHPDILREVHRYRPNFRMEDVHEYNLNDIIDTMRLPYRIVPHRAASKLKSEITFWNTIESDTLFYYDVDKGYFDQYGEQFIRAYMDRLAHDYLTKNNVGETIQSIKNGTMCSITAFNGAKVSRDGHLYLNLPNGTLEIDTLTLNEHSPQYMFTGRLPICYNPEADASKILSFLLDVSEPNYRMFFSLLEHAAFTFCPGYHIQKGILYQGTGGNGKGTWLHIINRLWDDASEHSNVASIALQDMDQRFKTSMLYGKAVNIAGDLSDEELRHTGSFKKATGGDPITAEYKNKPPFQFLNEAKLFYSCNKIPRTADESRGFYQRWAIEIWAKTFRGTDAERIHLGDELSSEENLEGLFKILVKWFIPIVSKRTWFTFDKDEETVKELYTRNSNSAQAFIIERLEFDKSELAVLETDEIISGYRQFCIDKNLFAESEDLLWKTLKEKMTDAGVPYKDRRWVRDGVSHHVRMYLKLREGQQALNALYYTEEEVEDFEDVLSKYVDRNKDFLELHTLQTLQVFFSTWFRMKEIEKRKGERPVGHESPVDSTGLIPPEEPK